MQIIIPMSGFGERFRRAGYSVPKPLIEIEGKPIIGHVIDMFPGEHNFIFICNQEHLDEPSYHMRQILENLCPTGKIIGIPPHKLGPIYAVLQAQSHIDRHSPVIVNYCDFTCYWDWQHFKAWINHSKCDGAVPAYRGFHPHTLGTTNYAYIREKNHWMLDIQEKQPFTHDRMNEYASSGTYYFSSGQLMLEAFQQTIEKNLHIGNEYYVSLAYKILLANDKNTAIYPLQHFMQWGTPEDVAEYQKWSTIFHLLSSPASHTLSAPQGTVIMLMAGLGQRFVNEGYTLTKPLIPVSGQPMLLQALHDLPEAQRYVFVLRQDMHGLDDFTYLLKNNYPNAIIHSIAHVTEGQACTGLIGLDALTAQLSASEVEPLIFGSCDNGALYDKEKLHHLMNDERIDIIVLGARGHAHAIRHPHMYGWIKSINNKIEFVSVKTALASPDSDPIILGTFIFKRAADYRRCVQQLIEQNDRINGEFYIDSCINHAIKLGLHCQLFEVDHYLSWGTPNDLRTFEYWQSCFHKWSQHAYQLNHDSRVANTNLLERQYMTMIPEFMESVI